MARPYLLDTNILSHLIRQPQGPIAVRIADVGEENVLTSIIVACELRYGAAKRGSRRLTRQVETVLGTITILSLGLARTPTMPPFAPLWRRKGHSSVHTTC